MRIDPPRDQPAPAGSADGQRAVEETARASSAVQKTAERDKGGEGSRRSFPELFEQADSDGAGDSSVALDDPDRDAWTRQVIGTRIHWQYGPDARRRPIFHHTTSRLDSIAEASSSDADSVSGEPV